MRRIFFLIFLAIPIFEITILIAVGTRIGIVSTLGLAMGTAVLGLTVIRRQRHVVWSRPEPNEGASYQGDPAQNLVNGFLCVFAGVLLIIPGFITDSIGGLILIRPIRSRIKSSVVQNGREHHFGTVFQFGADKMRADKPTQKPEQTVQDATYTIIPPQD